jgi:hypothetical protein
MMNKDLATIQRRASGSLDVKVSDVIEKGKWMFKSEVSS